MNDERKDASFDALKRLEERLKKAQGPLKKRAQPRPLGGNAMGIAFRIASELVAALAVGVAIGWALDKWLDTRPLFLSVFFFLGTGAGVLNVYRATKPADGADEIDKSTLPRIEDGDDDD